jgi:hypothetical protein
MRGLADHRLDFPVGGRHDLDSAVEIHLVAVVRRRIVRRGDLNARAGAEMARAERDYGSRDRGEHQCHHEAFCGKHLGGREGERLRPVPGVAAYHDPRACVIVILQYLRDGPGGPQHNREVHPVGPTADRSAKAGRTECQRMAEPVREFSVAARFQLRDRRRVGVVRDPFLNV